MTHAHTKRTSPQGRASTELFNVAFSSGQTYLDGCEEGQDIIDWAPSILKDV